MWDLWCTKCHYDRILFNYFGFLLSIPFFHPPYASVCYRRYIILSTDSVLKQNFNVIKKKLKLIIFTCSYKVVTLLILITTHIKLSPSFCHDPGDYIVPASITQV
jgi:hypothetical protein